MTEQETSIEGRSLTSSKDYLDKQGVSTLWNKISNKFVDNTDVIPITNGGTGCTTIDGVRTVLFDFPTEAELNEYFEL